MASLCVGLPTIWAKVVDDLLLGEVALRGDVGKVRSSPDEETTVSTPSSSSPNTLAMGSIIRRTFSMRASAPFADVVHGRARKSAHPCQDLRGASGSEASSLWSSLTVWMLCRSTVKVWYTSKIAFLYGRELGDELLQHAGFRAC